MFKYKLEKKIGGVYIVKRNGATLQCKHNSSAWCNSKCPNFNIAVFENGRDKKIELLLEISCGCIVNQYKIENSEIYKEESITPT
jgi:hypothetical protein